MINKTMKYYLKKNLLGVIWVIVVISIILTTLHWIIAVSEIIYK